MAEQLSLFVDEEDKINDDFQISLNDKVDINIGDIFQLGEHRLMCGDSTIKEHVDKLMDGNKADMCFTDPPYNVAFNGRSGKFDIIVNDNISKDDFEIFINKFIEIFKTLNIETYYIWCNWKFYDLLQSKLNFNACIVWAKNVFGMGIGYRHQHEFCLFNGKIKENIKNESDLWLISKDINYVHPTQKPIELAIRAINNHDANTILDLFGGSGSTLMAAELTKRKCYMMEIDPRYVDVIIKRYEYMFKKKAIKL